jgi:hypothetical protein
MLGRIAAGLDCLNYFFFLFYFGRGLYGSVELRVGDRSRRTKITLFWGRGYCSIGRLASAGSIGNGSIVHSGGGRNHGAGAPGTFGLHMSIIDN